ncbi:acid-sensing ion channel 2-like isoform X2 [Symsagittifera roscoffensis]|uniref:acid-sensing ion channel 2-like isoform X2 n=1 Tax=Symsagittifera roscoffensis TaxID=84072 RepID=UPI00307BE1AB
MESGNSIQHYSPSHYVSTNPPDGAAHPPLRQAISAPQTPVFAEYFVMPKDAGNNPPLHSANSMANGGIHNPNAQSYQVTNLPSNNFQMQTRPLIYQPASAPGLLYQQQPVLSPSPDQPDDSGLCGFLNFGFSKSFENLAYGDQENGDSPGGENHSFRVFAEETTMHGIKYVVLPGARITIKRVLWTLVFALFWVYFISVSVKKVQFYYSYQHITQLDEESQALDFPAITICNLNPIRLSAFTPSDLYNAGKMYDVIDDNMALKEDLFSDDNPQTKVLRQKLASLSDADRTRDFSLEEFQMRAGHKMKDMLKACKWRDLTCSYMDFKPVLTEMGLCYQYNSNATWDEETKSYQFKKVFKGGAGNGLKMLLVTEEDEYLPPQIESFETSLETGFKLEIHDPDVPPLVHQLGVGIAPGLQTFVVLQKEQVTYLTKPWGECVKTFEKTINFTKYSDPACRIECETEHIVDECDCRLPFMPVLSTKPKSQIVCSPAKYKDCAIGRLNKIEDGEACGPETCIKPCEISRYKSSMSSVKFPSYLGAIKLSEEYPGVFTKKTDGNSDSSGPKDGESGGENSEGGAGEAVSAKATQAYWKEQALVVSIYFQSLSLQTIIQVGAYDFAAMLGDIGGLMGLFIGASAMTLFEFFFFFCDSLILRRKGASRSSSTEETEKSEMMGENLRSAGGGLGEQQPLKSVLMAAPPGAVDGSKFVFNVNHNDHNAEYNAAMSRLLPQFSAHPLHNSFQHQQMQQQQQQQQQAQRGYSPLLKRPSYTGGGAFGQPQQLQQQQQHPNDGGMMSPHDASSYPASPAPPANGGMVMPNSSFPHQQANMPQNMYVTTAPYQPGQGGKIFLPNSLPQERYC